jgi:hypothetical protein
METTELKDDIFERCWIAYQRKGAKKVAKAQWDKLPTECWEQAEKHIPYYVASRERQFCKDFERYLRDRVFENPVYDRRNELIYDPDVPTDEVPSLPGFQG